MTVKELFEREATRMGVIVLQGMDAHDAHACVGEEQYVMLPGGETEDVTYAAGLHELGHLACVPTHDERMATFYTKIGALVPPSIYQFVLDNEWRAWQWAIDRALGLDNAAELIAVLTQESISALATYEGGYARNAVKWDKEVRLTQKMLDEELLGDRGADVTGLTYDEAETLTSILALAHASTLIDAVKKKGHVGCGECETCKANKARDDRAAALYREACQKRTTQ